MNKIYQKSVTLLTFDKVWKVASPDLIGLMLSRGAETREMFPFKTAEKYARENGDETLANLIRRAELFKVLASPRSVSRLVQSKCIIHILPKELLMKLSDTLFEPLLNFSQMRQQ